MEIAEKKKQATAHKKSQRSIKTSLFFKASHYLKNFSVKHSAFSKHNSPKNQKTRYS
jgi:hypothetical protein